MDLHLLLYFTFILSAIFFFTMGWCLSSLNHFLHRHTDLPHPTKKEYPK